MTHWPSPLAGQGLRGRPCLPKSLTNEVQQTWNWRQSACQRLPVDRSDHQPRRFIAEKIIECARSGNTTSSELTAAGIKAMPADGGDYTMNVVVGLDAEGRMHLLDLWRRRAAADQWVEALCDLVLAWKPIGWAQEQGQIRSGVGPFLEKRMRERGAFVARQQFAARGDKAVRAQSMRGRVALEGLYVPAGAS